MTQYYDLFPQEKADYSPEIKDMYYGKTISERCMEILVPLAKEYKATFTELYAYNKMKAYNEGYIR